METETFAIKGMHCASCQIVIEKTLKKVGGVESAVANYATEKLNVRYDHAKTNPDKLSKEIEPYGYSLIIEKPTHEPYTQNKEKLNELKNLKNKVLSVLPLAFIAVIVMGWDISAKYNLVMAMGPVTEELFHHLLPIFATYTLFVVGQPYLIGFYRFLRYGKANMDSLIGMGTTIAFVHSFIVSVFEETSGFFLNANYQYYDVTIVVIALVTLGKYLESKSKAKTGDAIEKLLGLQAKTALIYENGKEKEVPIESVKIGDILIIKPGAKIPVDGIITSGNSFIDESMITGEPMPKKVKEGDFVVGGTINQSGSFKFEAKKIGADTMLAEIIRMVEDAQGSKAPIQALADKISSVFVPTVLLLALTVLVLWLSVGSTYLGFSEALSYGILSFVGILVIACPCALGLATPTAIIVGVGKGAREGILIKDAGTLEKLHKVNTVVLDKTGTITKGHPSVVTVEKTGDKNENEIIQILAALESKSEHPIARAILDYAKEKGIQTTEIANFENIEGKGVKGTIGETEYFAGNRKLAEELGLKFQNEKLDKYISEGKTPVVIMTHGKVLGFVMIADEIKGGAKEAVASLHKLGVKVVMLTGDEERTARHIGRLVGIDEVIAHVLPADKLSHIHRMQKEGKIVAMVGDGVNDAPALAGADVGIAMATGTDVAIESAGITLLSGDISKLPKAFRLSRITMHGIKQNLFWAFFYNVVGIPLAGGLFYPIFGFMLNPVFAGLAMAMSSVSVVGNSLRIKSKKLA